MVSMNPKTKTKTGPESKSKSKFEGRFLIDGSSDSTMPSIRSSSSSLGSKSKSSSSLTTNKNNYMLVYLLLFVGLLSLQGLLFLHSNNKLLKPISTKILAIDDDSRYSKSVGNISLSSSENNIITIIVPSKFEYDKSNTIVTTRKHNNSSNIIEQCSFVEPPPVSAAVIKLNGTTPITPIWIPAYPGSGSEMFRALVKAATGLGGDDYYQSKCLQRPAFTCKTHWPIIKRFRRIQPYTMVGRFHQKAIFLIRNPRNALPSYFNYLFEFENKLKGRSQQAPEAEWRKYRDEILFGWQKQEFLGWKKILLEWQKQPFDIVHYIQYEDLINEKTGPGLFHRVIHEIRQSLPTVSGTRNTRNRTTATTVTTNTTTATSSSIHIAPDQDLECLWREVVKGDASSRDDTKTKTRKTKRAGHKYLPTYTQRQQHLLLEMLEELLNEFSNQLGLVKILEFYRNDIANNMTVEEEE